MATVLEPDQYNRPFAPIGYSDGLPDGNGGLAPIPEQQAAIARMRALRAEGLSLRAIRDRLATEGVRVSHVAVRNALRTVTPLDAQIIDCLRAAASGPRG